MPTKRVRKHIAVKSHKRCTRKSGVVKHRRRARGGSLKSWISGKVVPWLKNTRAVSKGLKFLDKNGVPYAGTAGRVAGVLGFGYKEDALKFAKQHRLLSRGLKYGATTKYGRKYATPLNIASQFAASQGYGLNRSGRGLNR